MIFSFTKATFTGRLRPIFDWLVKGSFTGTNMPSSGKAAPAGQNHQQTPADSSMFGLLVSSDASPRRCPQNGIGVGSLSSFRIAKY